MDNYYYLQLLNDNWEMKYTHLWTPRDLKERLRRIAPEHRAYLVKQILETEIPKKINLE